MPEKKLAAFVEAPGPPSEPAARRTCQPAPASAPASARATCAEPPRGKKNSAEQTRPRTPSPVGPSPAAVAADLPLPGSLTGPSSLTQKTARPRQKRGARPRPSPPATAASPALVL